jgi:Bacterial dnaA protein helix-turn-helix
VAAANGLLPRDLTGKSQRAECVEARHKAMFICFQMNRFSLPQIGREFGGRHHSTVIAAVRKMRRVWQNGIPPDLAEKFTAQPAEVDLRLRAELLSEELSRLETRYSRQIADIHAELDELRAQIRIADAQQTLPFPQRRMAS